MDRGRHRLARHDGGTVYARRPAQGHDSRRHHRGRGSCDSLPAADTHPLLLHLLYGGQRLHVARSVYHGPSDAQDGTPRQIVHPPHHGLRLQCAGSDGHAYHREPPQPSGHHAHPADDELLGATAHLCHDYRHLLCAELPAAHHVVALSRGHRDGGDTEPRLLPLCHQGRRYTLCDGAATLPLPHLEGHWPPYVGEGQAVSAQDGRHHHGGVDSGLGFGLFPSS